MTSYLPDPAYLRIADESGAPFFDAVEPAKFPEAILRYRNDRWSSRVGLNYLSDIKWVEHFAEFRPLPNNLPAPLALRYHGHQFRHYNPDLGDGRGFLFAQLRDEDGRLLDLATKGSGQTPYSRTADGRLTLKGAVREILATEMLEALGVYTSKTFSVIETGEALERHDEPSPTRSAVLVRLGHSHVRFGTFQRLGHEKDLSALNKLVDYCIECFDPDLASLAPTEKAVALYGRIVRRTARLASQWMAAGFVHGVLNTDNMNVTGESFDYGPWRFLPRVEFGFTAAYFDQTGLYAYGRQPDAAIWNLSRLGGVFAMIGEEDELNSELQTFAAAFETEMTNAFCMRLGVAPPDADGYALVSEILHWMEASKVPFEQFFFDWFCGRASAGRANKSPVAHLYKRDDFNALSAKIWALEPVEPRRLSQIYFSRTAPVTMLIDEVEAIWAEIDKHDDWAALHQKQAAIEEMRMAHAFQASVFKP